MMEGRFIVVVLDGFGVGEMPDTRAVRPRDIGANTCLHILRQYPDVKLAALEKLGLMNASGFETPAMRESPTAVFGRAELMHDGADTFAGHQEIMGTRPKKPFLQPFAHSLLDIAQKLRDAGYKVDVIRGREGGLLMVNGAVGIGDNLETDPGQNYNVTGALNAVSFEEEIAIGRIVRDAVQVARVIVFGGSVGPENLLSAVEERPGGIMGISAPKSGVYLKGYQCLHLGYGVNEKTQLPWILHKKGIPVTLFGKAADVVANSFGKSFSCVDTGQVLQLMLDEIEAARHGFFCANVQETDLAGHQQDPALFLSRLRTADQSIGRVIEAMRGNDILIVMADHGNDPTIGHPQHTREMAPLLVHCPSLRNDSPVFLGQRATLSDVAATAAEYFSAGSVENGVSFLDAVSGIVPSCN